MAADPDGPNRFFLVGDLNQKVFAKQHASTRAGFDLTGRSRTLAQNYRNTRQILAAAYRLAEARKFLADGGKASRLPNANQLWMLVGFELFRTLGTRYECVETYPQAVVHELRCAAHHKSTEQGLDSQIGEAGKVLGLSSVEMRAKLLTMGYGSTHDRLDVFLSAWIASLDERDRRGYGTPPGEVIWVPKVAHDV